MNVTSNMFRHRPLGHVGSQYIRTRMLGFQAAPKTTQLISCIYIYIYITIVLIKK